MRKPTFYLSLIVGVALFLSTSARAESLPVKTPVQTARQAAVNVPPPVLRAFASMLLSVAGDYGFGMADIRNFSIRWTKEKNEYSVSAKFEIAGCDEGEAFNELVAKFKANGNIVPITGLNGQPANYVFYFTNCIRAPF
jgi:hypothetical protein